MPVEVNDILTVNHTRDKWQLNIQGFQQGELRCMRTALGLGLWIWHRFSDMSLRA